MPTDPLYKSWRAYALLFSAVSLWAQASALLGKVQPMIADGLTPAEAIEILDQAGPMLQSADQVLGLAASAIAALAILVSKILSRLKALREKTVLAAGAEG